jgi:hypothetical protein
MIDLTKDHITFSENFEDLVDIQALPMECRITLYEELMAKSLIMRANARVSIITIDNQEAIFPYIKYVIQWLRTTDFYTSPASTKYHDSFSGGLLTHTLQVYAQLVGLKSVPKFKSVVEHSWYSAVFVALVHDWCKIGRYEQYLKNVKNPDTNEWEQVVAYKIKEDDVTRFGHGTQSLIMAGQLCNFKYTALSFEEMAAIRWHMDAWDIGKYDEADLDKCNTKIPLVRMIQFADQLAITEY